MLVAASAYRALRVDPNRTPAVPQVKIVRDEERRDARGNPRSKGFGFLEFEKHEHALATLQALSDNPKANVSPTFNPLSTFLLRIPFFSTLLCPPPAYTLLSTALLPMAIQSAVMAKLKKIKIT